VAERGGGEGQLPSSFNFSLSETFFLKMHKFGLKHPFRENFRAQLNPTAPSISSVGNFQLPARKLQLPFGNKSLAILKVSVP